MTTPKPVPMFHSTVLMDEPTNEQISLIDGFRPLPVGSTVRVLVSASLVREFQVMENRLTVGSDATLILYCKELQKTRSSP